MTIKSLAAALPTGQNTGWSLAGRRITEELKKLALVSDLNGTGLLEIDQPVDIKGSLLQPLQGVNCLPVYPHVRGDFNVGYCFIEDDIAMRRYALNVKRNFDHVICGSTWALHRMEEALNEIKAETGLSMAIQGVDSDLFCPAETPMTDPKWFTVLSAGKWEYRKGQDVVLAAMKVMMERHPDVRLLASWWNPWHGSAATMQASKIVNYSQFSTPATPCQFSIMDCAAKYLGPLFDRVEFVWETPHAKTPDIYRRADVALFPNRCEAGTNLPLMESAACGVPIIATVERGHSDVAGAIYRSVAVKEFTQVQQTSQGNIATGNWFEPDLENVISELEYSYEAWKCNGLTHRGAAARRGIIPFTWKRCTESILEVF